MSQVKLRIATMLAHNVQPAQIARAVNCTEAYISDLRDKDEGFMAAVQELKAQTIEQEMVVDQAYDDIEKSVLSKMSELVATADIRELGIALKAVNERAQRVGRGNQHGNNNGVGGNVVPIQLPVYMAQKISITTNERNEIVEVEGKSMVSLSPAQLTEQISTMGRSSGVEDVKDTVAIEHAENIQNIENIQMVAGQEVLDEPEQGTNPTREAISTRLKEITVSHGCMTSPVPVAG